jgi:electron transfer flavoprotein alpha/beta subunit
VKLKEKNGGSVTALCVGKSDAKKSVKEALAMGCDRARLLIDPAFEDGDAVRTGYILSKAIKKIGKYDIVLTATGTTDVYSGVVGPALAEFLGVPQITFVSKLSLSGNKVTAERLLEEGIETVEAELPVLITVAREINQPRFPTLIQIMSAGKKEALEWNAKDLEIEASTVGKTGSLVSVESISVPRSARKKMIFEGSAEETSGKLADALLKEGVVS